MAELYHLYRVVCFNGQRLFDSCLHIVPVADVVGTFGHVGQRNLHPEGEVDSVLRNDGAAWELKLARPRLDDLGDGLRDFKCRMEDVDVNN